MVTKDINALFSSKEIQEIIVRILKKYDHRLCLNFNVMEVLRNYFSDIIMFSFVVQILPSELADIYNDSEKYISQKILKL